MGEPMFDDPESFDTYVDKMSIGTKNKFEFYELPYWEHINISHLLDSMHILTNGSYSLWKHISSNKNKTLVVRRDIISLKRNALAKKRK
jgi:hypothetical protein